MAIEYRCGNCNKILRTPDDNGGKKGRCPHCQAIMDIPVRSTVLGESPLDPPAGRPPFGQAPLGSPERPTGPTVPVSRPTPLHDPHLDSPAPRDPFMGSPAPRDPYTGSASGGSPPANPFGDLPTPQSSGSSNPYSSPRGSSQPWGGSPRTGGMPHRGGMILTLGILGIVAMGTTCAPVGLGLGIAAWTMGNTDLAAIQAGRMDITGENLTRAGKVLGVIAVVVNALGMLGCGCLIFISILADK
ncbi:hypothetical protein [Lignipirellula cremea]|uniref:DUF4190 domain-containing protein n=1 Tax=Lignipirellula cremea TaxID=2528010 RepID=A0A518E1C3_9BACT|nr:hypothetical protein [Lignipirellula cremea]QDU97889.1 hypothetical protein Pla8534_57460 [Lignipirellula cremea]